MVRIAALSLLFLLLCYACKKSDDGASVASGPLPGDIAVNVTVDVTTLGAQIAPSFTGLSFEMSALKNSGYFDAGNPVFVNLVKGLGTGLLRIGGNSADRIGTPKTSDIDRTFGFAAATGWKLMFALDLGDDNLSAAVEEARYVYSKYASQLECLEIGNEPDLYRTNGLRDSTYSYTDFRKEFDRYYDSIRVAVPGAIISGPADGANTDAWTVPFAKDEKGRIRWLTQHYYKMGPPTSPNVTVDRLLNGNMGILSQAETMRAAVKINGLPGYRISECNSVFGGGKMGVSNTFGSALWGLDYMYTLAEQGAVGVNFHGGGAGAYTPIAYSNGTFSARPLYYGMLLFAQASNGRILNANIQGADSIRLSVHVLSGDDTKSLRGVRMILINRDHSRAAWVTVPGGRIPLLGADVLRLTGGNADSTQGTTLGGATVDDQGNWHAGNIEHVILRANECMLRIPAGSAALVKFY